MESWHLRTHQNWSYTITFKCFQIHKSYSHNKITTVAFLFHYIQKVFKNYKSKAINSQQNPVAVEKLRRLRWSRSRIYRLQLVHQLHNLRPHLCGSLKPEIRSVHRVHQTSLQIPNLIHLRRRCGCYPIARLDVRVLRIPISTPLILVSGWVGAGELRVRILRLRLRLRLRLLTPFVGDTSRSSIMLNVLIRRLGIRCITVAGRRWFDGGRVRVVGGCGIEANGGEKRVLGGDFGEWERRALGGDWR